jgi:hypothetical protein
VTQRPLCVSVAQCHASALCRSLPDSPPARARESTGASRDKHSQFRALLHYVNVEALAPAFGRLKGSAAAESMGWMSRASI